MTEGTEVDPFRKLADRLRKKNGLPFRSAVMDDERVEYVRGKDFERHFKKNPELLDEYLPKTLTAGKAIDEKVSDLMKVMVQRGLLVRGERAKLKPAKGKEKLSAWPRNLKRFRAAGADQLSTEDAFYAWTYERPTSITTYILGGLAALLVVLVCLFPLAPFSVKLATVYVCYALLTVILGLIVVRLVVFLAFWLVAGRHIWILPNLLRDDLGFFETFAIGISVDVDEKGKPVPRTALKYRLAMAAGLAGVGYALWQYDTSNLAVKGLGSMHDHVLDFLDSSKAKREMIGGAAGGAGVGGMKMPGAPGGGQFGPGADFIKQAEQAAAAAAAKKAAEEKARAAEPVVPDLEDLEAEEEADEAAPKDKEL